MACSKVTLLCVGFVAIAFLVGSGESRPADGGISASAKIGGGGGGGGGHHHHHKSPGTHHHHTGPTTNHHHGGGGGDSDSSDSDDSPPSGSPPGGSPPGGNPPGGNPPNGGNPPGGSPPGGNPPNGGSPPGGNPPAGGNPPNKHHHHHKGPVTKHHHGGPGSSGPSPPNGGNPGGNPPNGGGNPPKGGNPPNGGGHPPKGGNPPGGNPSDGSDDSNGGGGGGAGGGLLNGLLGILGGQSGSSLSLSSSISLGDLGLSSRSDLAGPKYGVDDTQPTYCRDTPGYNDGAVKQFFRGTRDVGDAALDGANGILKNVVGHTGAGGGLLNGVENLGQEVLCHAESGFSDLSSDFGTATQYAKHGLIDALEGIGNPKKNKAGHGPPPVDAILTGAAGILDQTGKAATSITSDAASGVSEGLQSLGDQVSH